MKIAAESDKLFQDNVNFLNSGKLKFIDLMSWYFNHTTEMHVFTTTMFFLFITRKVKSWSEDIIFPMKEKWDEGKSKEYTSETFFFSFKFKYCSLPTMILV